MTDTGQPHFEPLSRDDLPQRIARILTDAIVSGKLRPGDRVSESAVARDLQVSRAPVREAARLVESAGLLTSQPNRGFFVRTFTADDVDSLYELRICIETEGAARLARNGASEAMPRLRRQIEAMLELAETGQTHEQIGADMAFHRMILEACGNRRFVAVFDQIASETQACVALIGRLYDDPVRLAETHIPIVDAIASGDPEATRAALDYHIRVAREVVVPLFREIEETSPR